MPGIVPLLALLGLAASPAEASPPPQTLVFYNARIALREGRSADVLKLWLLHNALQSRGLSGPEDDDFRSAVWAATGNLALCQDGYPDDASGAGLWPIALFNTTARTMAQSAPPDVVSPFAAFDVGRQQRFVSLSDILSEPELRTVSFFRTGCSLPLSMMKEIPELAKAGLRDRFVAARVLRRLLTMSLQTLVRAKVQSVAVVQARIFDLDLALSQLQAGRVRQEAQEAKRRALRRGASERAAQEVVAAATEWQATTEQTRFLRECLAWPQREWMALSRPQRTFLFAHARPFAQDAGALDGLVLAIIDELAARGEGEELEQWIGFFDAGGAPLRRRTLTDGERGKRLLELDSRSRFRERATIALHRGVALLEEGKLQDSLRSFAFAMATAESSREAAKTMALARRWLSFVLSRYETSEEVIAMLRELVPRQEYNAVIEDLVWAAALRADAESFERVVATARRGGAFDILAARLRPLSQGKAGELATTLRDAVATEPSLTLRFMTQLIERMEAQEAEVRAANIPLLKIAIELLSSMASKPKSYAPNVRAAEELVARAHSMLEGLGHLDVSLAGRVRSLSPRHETFAGNVRLAPADVLPWPFRTPEPDPPSAFSPLTLEPVEWRSADGAWVFGWRIAE